MNIPNKQKGRENVYDPALKIAIAQEYFTSNLGFTKLARKYGLPGEATARHFVRWYKKKYPEGFTKDENVIDNQSDKLASKEIKEANLKVTALQMLIENASKELGIDLVKKFGTKQSKK
jgi:transposase-like protein